MIHKSPTTITRMIQEILHTNAISTQEDICAELRKKGLLVNQVRISRILHKMGAIKINEQGKTVYRLPSAMNTFQVRPTDSLKHLILSIIPNEAMIIIQTSPGSAQLVARLLDLHRQKLNILGTVAGDDTIFVAPKTVKTIKKLALEIESYLQRAEA